MFKSVVSVCNLKTESKQPYYVVEWRRVAYVEDFFNILEEVIVKRKDILVKRRLSRGMEYSNLLDCYM